MQPIRPILIYPAHSFRYDGHVADLVKLLNPIWQEGRHFAITAPRVHTPLETGGSDQQCAHFLIDLMAASDVMWAMAGVYASLSPWIGMENGFAGAAGLPAVAIVPRGQERVSTVATAGGTRPELRWQTASIIEGTVGVLSAQKLEELYPNGSLLGYLRGRVDDRTWHELWAEAGRSPRRAARPMLTSLPPSLRY